MSGISAQDTQELIVMTVSGTGAATDELQLGEPVAGGGKQRRPGTDSLFFR